MMTSTKPHVRQVKPYPGCRLCHGSGTVYDWVPYGMGNTAMPSTCDCVLEQVDDGEEFTVVPAEQEDYDEEFYRRADYEYDRFWACLS